MKTLKELCESILDSTKKKVSKVGKIVAAERKAFMQRLENISRGWIKYVDDQTYQDILDYTDEIPSEEKKGKRWEYFIPNENSNFKPVAVSYAHFVRRTPTCKEFCGTTESAIDKRLKKAIKNRSGVYDKLLLGGSGILLRYFMLIYEQVDEPTGSGWISESEYVYKEDYILYSINPTTRQWCYGCPANAIPNEMKIGNSRVVREWVKLSNSIVGATEKDGVLCAYLDDNVFTVASKYIKNADVEEYKKTKSDWIKIFRTRPGYGTPYGYVYMNRKTLQYITQEDIENSSLPDYSNTKLGMTITADEFDRRFKRTGVNKDAIFSSRKALMEEIYATGAPIYCNESYYVHESKYHRVIKVGNTFQCNGCKGWEDWRECHYYSEYVDKNGNKAWMMTGGRYD